MSTQQITTPVGTNIATGDAHTAATNAAHTTASSDLVGSARRWANKLRDYNAAQSPPRFAFVKQAELEAVDASGSVSGQRVGVVTRDLSEAGIGFLIENEIPPGAYFIYLPGNGSRPLSGIRRKRIEVLRVQSLGVYFDASAKFSPQTESVVRQTPGSGPLDQIDAGVTRLRQHQLAMHELVRSIDRRLQRANSIPKQPE